MAGPEEMAGPETGESGVKDKDSEMIFGREKM